MEACYTNAPPTSVSSGRLKPSVQAREYLAFQLTPQKLGVQTFEEFKRGAGRGQVRFARIDLHDSRESGDSRESEIRVIRANRPRRPDSLLK